MRVAFVPRLTLQSVTKSSSPVKEGQPLHCIKAILDPAYGRPQYQTPNSIEAPTPKPKLNKAPGQ